MATETSKYYLETNALYALGKNIIGVPNNAFTSALSIIEIIGGITESNYSKRKSIIAHIVNSGIEIVWKRPKEVYNNAFKVRPVDTAIPDLQQLVKKICDCDDFTVYLTTVDDLGLKFHNEFFKNLDTVNGSDFINVSLEGQRKIYNEAKKPADFEVLKNLKDHPWNRELTIQAMIYDIVEQIPGAESDPDFPQLLRKAYNGSVDIYVTNFSYYCALSLRDRSVPGRNDKTDLDHLAYLKDESYVLVSNDTLFREIFTQTAIGKVITVDDFKRQIQQTETT